MSKDKINPTTEPTEKECISNLCLTLFDEALMDIIEGKAKEDEFIVNAFCDAYSCTNDCLLAVFFKGFIAGLSKGMLLNDSIKKPNERSTEQ